ncbi:hypothetical protein [Zhaonella formicivorans]|uniref:hypothetical protein n=1 Tax=Zhaonella formicivorans TaxID=2528593 RepID=UPI0010DC5866|nr:hypothetical protein [Zhaonella formicivorans]
MLKDLKDSDYQSFINSSVYCAVGFYANDEDSEKMLALLEDFQQHHASCSVAKINVENTETAKSLGVTRELAPLIVIYDSGKPKKALNKATISAENLAASIEGGTKNITLQ